MAVFNTDTNESMGMDHETAVRSQAATRYLASELSGAELEAFEEHYFTCAECANEVRDGELFASTLRDVFSEEANDTPALPESALPPDKPVPQVSVMPARAGSRRNFFTGGLAIAASLFGIAFVYDRAVLFPRMKGEIASLTAPQQPTRVTLKQDRQSPEPTHLSNRSKFWFAEFQLHDPNVFQDYVCEIEDHEGRRTADVFLERPKPGLPFTIQLPREKFAPGSYVFRVRGRNEKTPIATYTIDLNPE